MWSMRESRKGGGWVGGVTTPLENENLFNLDSQIITNMPRYPPPPRLAKRNYPSDPPPWKKIVSVLKVHSLV